MVHWITEGSPGELVHKDGWFGGLLGVGHLTSGVPGHYGLRGGWVQKSKALYLAYFLQSALTDYASGKA